MTGEKTSVRRSVLFCKLNKVSIYTSSCQKQSIFILAYIYIVDINSIVVLSLSSWVHHYQHHDLIKQTVERGTKYALVVLLRHAKYD